jgi:hypothetical protein
MPGQSLCRRTAVIAGLGRYDEIMWEIVGQGRMAHALRFAAQLSHGAFVRLAIRLASCNQEGNVAPMGKRNGLGMTMASLHSPYTRGFFRKGSKPVA